MDNVCRTPLYEKHLQHQAKMINFQGWLLPLQYNRINQEVQETRRRAALFDVTHMGRLSIEGESALDFLQSIVTANLDRLIDRQAVYTLICREDGGTLDDILLYRFQAHQYLIITNAANTVRVYDWLNSKRTRNVQIFNHSSAQAQLALQGPQSQQLLEVLSRRSLSDLPRFRFQPELSIQGIRCLVSRTGYTGEDGFELICRADQASSLWDRLVPASGGSPPPVFPAGLGARDILRIEAGFPLYGSELDEGITPLEAGLAKFVDLKEKIPPFYGREALLQQKRRGLTRKLWGLIMQDRGIPRPGYPVRNDEGEIGHITSGCYSPTLDQSIAMAFLNPQQAWKGREVAVEMRGARKTAQLVTLPFYRRG